MDKIGVLNRYLKKVETDDELLLNFGAKFQR